MSFLVNVLHHFLANVTEFFVVVFNQRTTQTVHACQFRNVSTFKKKAYDHLPLLYLCPTCIGGFIYVLHEVSSRGIWLQ